MNWLHLLLIASGKGVFLLCLAGAAAWLLRRGSAAGRYLVWLMALGGLLCLPWLEHVSSWLPASRTTAASWALLTPLSLTVTATGASRLPAAASLWLMLWVFGALVVVARVLHGVWRWRQIAHTASPWSTPAWGACQQELHWGSEESCGSPRGSLHP